jgi:hypothetical protein
MAAEIKPYNLYKSAGRDIYRISLPYYIHIFCVRTNHGEIEWYVNVLYTKVPLHTIACIICRYNCIKVILGMVNGRCESCNCNRRPLLVDARIHTYIYCTSEVMCAAHSQLQGKNWEERNIKHADILTSEHAYIPLSCPFFCRLLHIHKLLVTQGSLQHIQKIQRNLNVYKLKRHAIHSS